MDTFLDWVPIVVAVIAVAISAATAMHTYNQDKRRQARQVSAWTHRSSDKTPMVTVANHSDAPVFHWTVDYHFRGIHLGSTRIRPTIPGGTERSVGINSKVWANFKSEIENHDGHDRTIRDISAAVEFTDNTGSRWKRDHFGKLARVKNPDPEDSGEPGRRPDSST